jgi:hypothetical protein
VHQTLSGAPDQGTLRLSLALFVEPNSWSFYWLSVNLWHLYNLYTRAKLVSPIICVGQFNHQNQLGTRCKPNSLSTSLVVERVDDAGAPAGDTSGVDLASETKTSVVSPQHTNPKRTDDASTLAKDLLGVSLVPKITVQSVPDATSSPSVDQEVLSVFHPVPFRFSFDPPSDPASVNTFVKAYPNFLGYQMWSTWDRLTTVLTYGPPGSEEDDEPDSGWDFSGLGNPSAMRDFMTACDYCLSDYSDGGHSVDDEDCGPSRECFHIDLGGLDEGNHLGMPEDDDPPRPAPRVDILRELAVVPVPAGGQDTQLEQIREMQARLDKEAGQLVQLRQNIGQEWTG